MKIKDILNSEELTQQEIVKRIGELGDLAQNIMRQDNSMTEEEAIITILINKVIQLEILKDLDNEIIEEKNKRTREQLEEFNKIRKNINEETE